MDLKFTREQESFKQEVIDFCHQNMEARFSPEYAQTFRNKISQKKWPGLSIPEKYGGLGKGAIHRVIFMEETSYLRAPIVHYDYGVTISLLGNMLLRHGTEEQKREYLPLIANGTIHCGQGYSEPEAGNDLANIQSRAIRRDDHFVVNGQKMWVHDALTYKYSLFMVRTDPHSQREQGLSLLLVDNKSHGVKVIPQLAMNRQLTPQVFLDNVAVPVSNLIGDEGKGWQYYIELKPFYWNKEQGAEIGMIRRLFDDAILYLKNWDQRITTKFQYELTKQKMAEIIADIHALCHMVYRMAWMEEQGLDLFEISAKLRVFHVETWLKFTSILASILGREGILEPGETDAALSGMMSRVYPAAALQLMQRAGPSYIKNIIATEILGMPKPW
jgi:alkylation response protein AidB-like acyl-CoA dehydrogenase